MNKTDLTIVGDIPTDEETPELDVAGQEALTLEEQEEVDKVMALPDNISWPDDFVKNHTVDEIRELYNQIATAVIEKFTGTPTWILFQFENPTSIRFGIQTSEPKPSNESMHAVLARIVRELETIHGLEIQDQRMAAMQAAVEAQQDNETELVDANGLVMLRANREQKRHPEKYGLTRRPKRVN